MIWMLTFVAVFASKSSRSDDVYLRHDLEAAGAWQTRLARGVTRTIHH